MNLRNWLTKIAIVLALLSIIAACSPQNASMSPQEVESALIAKEQQKWDMFRAGTFSQVSNMYADDFINVSADPAGTFRQNKQEAIAALASLPPMDGEITLSDFLVVHPDENTAIVSYKVTAFFGNEYATSVWKLRDNEWVTVLYQGTPIMATAEPVSSIPFSGVFKSTSGTVRINPDGTYAVDSGSTGVYGTTGRLAFSSDFVTFIDDDRIDVPECYGDQRSGTYQYTFASNSLIFTNVDDQCSGRILLVADRDWTKK